MLFCVIRALNTKKRNYMTAHNEYYIKDLRLREDTKLQADALANYYQTVNTFLVEVLGELTDLYVFPLMNTKTKMHRKILVFSICFIYTLNKKMCFFVQTE